MSFIKNTFSLIAGNAGAQALNFLTIPILTRFYGPESFGIMALMVSFSAMIIEISTLRFQFVILLPKEESQTMNAFFLSIFFVAVFTGCLFFLNFIFIMCHISLPLGYAALTKYILWIPIYVFCAGIWKPLNLIGLRNDNTLRVAMSILFNVLTSKVFSIVYAFFWGGSAIGLIAGLVLGQLVASCILIDYRYLKQLGDISVTELKMTFLKYKQFVLYSPTAFLESFSKEMAPLFLGFFFHSTVLGFYGLSQRVIQQPLNILGDSVSRSFYQSTSRAKREGGDYGAITVKIFNSMIGISFVPVLLFAMIAPEVFGILFGVEWVVAGDYFRLLFICFYFGFLYRPFSIFFEIQEKQKLRFQLIFFNTLIYSIGLASGLVFKSEYISIAVYSSVSALMSISLILFLFSISGINYKKAIKSLFVYVFIGLTLATFVILFKKVFGLNNPIFLILLVSSLIFLYLLFYVYLQKNELKSLLKI